MAFNLIIFVLLNYIYEEDFSNSIFNIVKYVNASAGRTGSDWCGWCIRLQKEVFKTPEFIKWAKESVVLVELDFPRKNNQTEVVKTQNAQLQQQLQVRGYPTVWFVEATKTADAKVNLNALGSTGYVAGGPQAWLSGANQIIKKK